MAIIWKNKLFEYFGAYAKRNDTNKNGLDQGFFERYNMGVGASLDYEITPKIDNFMANLYDPETCLDRYVVYLESMMGYNQDNNTLYLSAVINPNRRNMLKKFRKLCLIRGTKRCYTILLAQLGLAVTFTENFNQYGFDSPVTFDDPIRRFDMRCDTCSTYELALTGTVTMTPTLLEAILSMIAFNEPINATLSVLTYNGSPIGNFLAPDFDYSFDLSFNS